VQLLFTIKKALIIQRGLQNRYYPGLWAVPGGGKEPEDLTIQDTAERETLEELGLVINAKNVVIQNNFQEKPEGMFFKVLAELTNNNDYTVNYQYSNEVNDYKWVSENELDGYEFTPYTKEVIRATLKEY